MSKDLDWAYGEAQAAYNNQCASIGQAVGRALRSFQIDDRDGVRGFYLHMHDAVVQPDGGLQIIASDGGLAAAFVAGEWTRCVEWPTSIQPMTPFEALSEPHQKYYHWLGKDGE